jgi:hypothetical protein
MDKSLNKINMISFILIILAFITGFAAQFCLYLSQNVDLSSGLSSLSSTILANQYIGLILYLIAGVLFTFGIKKFVCVEKLFNVEQLNLAQPLNKLFLIFGGVGGFLYFVSILCYFVFPLAGFILWILSIISFALSLFFKDSKDKLSFKINYSDLFIVLAFVMSAVFLYGLQLDILPQKFHDDEAKFAINSLSAFETIAHGAFFQPNILFYAIQNFIFDKLGETIFALRVFSVAVSLLTLVFFYFLAKKMFNQKIAIVSTLIFFASHLYIALSRIGDHYVTGIFIFVLFLYFLIKGLKNNSVLFLFLSGVVSGFGYFFHKNAQVVIVVAVVYFIVLLINNLSNKKELLKKFVVVLVGFILTTFPLVLNNPSGFFERMNFAPAFTNDGMQHMKQVYNTSNPVVVLGVNFQKTLKVFNSASDNSCVYGNNKALLDFVSAVLLVFALFTAMCFIKDYRYSLLSVSFIVMALFEGVLGLDVPRFPDFALLLPVLALLIGSVLFNFSEYFASIIPVKKVSTVISVCLVVAITGIIVFLNINSYFGYYINNNIGDSKYYVPSIVGNYISSVGKFNRVYLVNFKGDPVVITPEDPSVKFLSKGVELYELKDALQEIPVKEKVYKDVSFVVFKANYEKSYKLLKRVYPVGEEKIFADDSGAPVLSVYEVKPNDINSKI